MLVTKDAIEEVRRSHDLVQVIRESGVVLERQGRNYVGPCPFHEDHTPSLVVSPEKQLWNCLGGCRGAVGSSGGDVIAFVRRKHGLDFVAALRHLGYREPIARVGGRPRPSTGAVAGPAARSRETGEMRTTPVGVSIPADLLKRVSEHYHLVFRERREGQEYLQGRGLTDPDVFSAFEVGYVDGSLLGMLDAKASRDLSEIGILTSARRELLMRCVVFPLTLPDSGVVGLYGRHIGRERHLYLPGPRRGVFHWQAMKGAQEIILTESVIDALTLYQAGLRNVSAIYGVQGLTADHLDLLQRFRVRRARLCLDNDEAGTRATTALIEKLRGIGIEASDARMPGAKDPNALLIKLGREAFAETVRNSIAKSRENAKGKATPADSRSDSSAPPSPPLTAASEEKSGEARGEDVPGLPTASAFGGPAIATEPGGGWRIKYPKRSYRIRDLSSTEWGRLRVNVRAEAGGKMYPDTLDLYIARSRASLVREMSREFGHPEEEIAGELMDLIDHLEAIRLDLRNKKATTPGSPEITDAESAAALGALRRPDLLEQVLADFERTGFVGEKTALTVGYLVTISRLLPDPLGLLIVSRSGAGKSGLQDSLCDFVPPEMLAKFTRVTGQALFYKEEESLMYKVLAIDEERGAADATYSLRILQSEQELSTATTGTDAQTGKHQTEERKVKGPVAIVFTTASAEALDYETRNRFVQVGIDESTEQTRRILARQREAQTLDGLLARKEAEALRRKHHTMQRLLRPLEVIIPQARSLTFPDNLLQMRREHRKYLTLIKAVALLHQYQREVKRAIVEDEEVEYIEASAQDIATANRLARAVLGHSLDELAPPTRSLLKDLVTMTAHLDRPFTRLDVKQHTGWNENQVRVHLGHLVKLEYVVLNGGGPGKRMTYRLLFEGDPQGEARYLAGLVDVEDASAEARPDADNLRGKAVK
jgi:DNA primase catalytic core